MARSNASFEIVDDDHRATLDQRRLNLARPRQSLERDFDRLGHALRDLADGRQQHGRLVTGTVLGLRNQVGGNPFGMRAIVGNHQHLARPRHLVDIGDAIDHPLGGLHVRVAGPDDLVHRLDGLGAVGERRDRMRPADAVEFVDPGNFRGRQHGQPLALADGGDTITISATPATLAGIAFISTDDGYAPSPPGT